MRSPLQCAKLLAIAISLNALAASAQSPGSSNPAARKIQPAPQAQRTAKPPSNRQPVKNSDQLLTLSQRWAMACPALLSEINQERMDSFDIWDRTPENIQVEKKSLEEWWGISNREDLLHTLKWVDEAEVIAILGRR